MRLFIVLLIVSFSRVVVAGEKESLDIKQIARYIGPNWEVKKAGERVSIESKFDVLKYPAGAQLPAGTPFVRLGPDVNLKDCSAMMKALNLKTSTYKLVLIIKDSEQYTDGDYEKDFKKKLKLFQNLKMSRERLQVLDAKQKYKELRLPRYTTGLSYIFIEGNEFDDQHVIYPYVANLDIAKMYAALSLFLPETSFYKMTK